MEKFHGLFALFFLFNPPCLSFFPPPFCCVFGPFIEVIDRENASMKILL